MNKAINISFSVCILFFLLVACKNNTKNVIETDQPLVKVIKVERKIYNEELVSFGTISYKTKNDITIPVEGTLIYLGIKEGDQVKKNQILARLRNVQLELQRDQAQNAIESAQAVLTRMKPRKWEIQLGVENKLISVKNIEIRFEQKKMELTNAKENLLKKSELLAIGGITDTAFKSESLAVLSLESEIALMENELESARLGSRDSDLVANGIVPSGEPEAKKKQFIDLSLREINAEIESAEAGLRNANSSFDSIKRLIEELTVKSPVSGILGAKYYELGEFIKGNEKLFTIIDISTVVAVFSIQEQDIIYFTKGSQLLLDIQSLGQKIQTNISDISPMADPESGNFTVKAEIKNTSEKIKPGMFVKCLIPKKADEKVLSLSESAVIKKNGENFYVYSVINSIIVLKEINVRSIKNGIVWIDSGVEVNEIVVDYPSPFLKEGQNVKSN